MERQDGAIAPGSPTGRGVDLSRNRGNPDACLAVDSNLILNVLPAMTTLQTMQAIFKTNFGLGPERLPPEANLEDLEIDSLSMIEVLFAVEDEFKITVPPQPAAWRSETKTVGDLVSYIDGLIVAQRPVMAGAEESV